MPNPMTIDTVARIETPESVWLTFRLAGPWSRMTAYLIDFFLRFLFGALVSMACAALAIPLGGQAIGVLLVGVFILEWGYAWLFEAFRDGKTPGKHIMRIRVVKTSGSPIGFYDAAIRNLLRAADFLPFGNAVGLVSILATERFQRLGDLVAGTIVVHDDRPAFRTRVAGLEGIQPLPRAARAGAWRPPERVLDLIDRLYRRRREIHPDRAQEIASILAPVLHDRLGLDDAADPASDSPARYLLRVLRTFTAPEDDGAARASSPRGEPVGAPAIEPRPGSES